MPSGADLTLGLLFLMGAAFGFWNVFFPERSYFSRRQRRVPSTRAGRLITLAFAVLFLWLGIRHLIGF
jgi:hypothetical protein